MTVQAPFRIIAEDVERTSLEWSDLGKWALIVCGCYHVYETRDDAEQARRVINS